MNEENETVSILEYAKSIQVDYLECSKSVQGYKVTQIVQKLDEDDNDDD